MLLIPDTHVPDTFLYRLYVKIITIYLFQAFCQAVKGRELSIAYCRPYFLYLGLCFIERMM